MLLSQALDAGGGVLASRRHPELGRVLRRAVTNGRLVALLPGAYVVPGSEADLWVRARAVAASDPRAVVTGRAAAHLSGWAEAGTPQVLTAASQRLHGRAGFCFERRTIPPSLVRRVDGVRLTSRALTVLDLLPGVGAEAVDEALRRRIPLAQLEAALSLTPGRPGNTLRRRLLDESRDEAWSKAERCAHAALHLAGVEGWVANWQIGLDEFTDAFVDIAFRPLRLAVEVDGRAHHESWDAACRDRRRDRRLAGLGWRVVRFPAAEVLADPAGFAQEVRELVAFLAARDR